MASKSIRTKIILNTSLIIFLGGFLTALGMGFLSYQREVDNFQEKLILKSELSSEKINILFNNHSSVAESLSKNEKIIDILNNLNSNSDISLINKEINELISVYNLKNGYEDIKIVDNFGRVISSRNIEKINENISYSSYFKRSIAGYSTINSLFYPEEGKTSYFFSEAIRNRNNQIIGVVVIRIGHEEIMSLVQSGLEERQNSFIIDENGVITCSSDENYLYKSLGDLNPSISRKIIEEQRFPGKNISSLGYQNLQNLIASGLTSTINEKVFQNNREKIITISPIGSSRLFELMETDLEEANILALKTGVTTFIPTILTIFIIIIFIYFLISNLLKPINSLKKTAISIGLGVFNQDKKIESGDELDELENVILNTANQLKSAYDEMEEKVRTRTSEIEKKNEQAERTNQAMLNIMEDIEKEKSKVEFLANDLKKFKLALDNTSEQVLIADTSARILYANKGMEALTGYKIKEVIGKTTAELWRVVEDQKQEEKVWSRVFNQKKSYSGEFKCRHKNGKEYFEHKTISPILNEAGEVEFLISISYDKTKEKEVDKAKTEFVSLASHQLRTPLSSINWYAEMLLAGDAGALTDDQKSFIEEISKGNKRMVSLVNSLLDVSRLELGTFTVAPEIMDICDPAKSVINELKPGIQQKKLKVTFNCAGDIPKIKADPKLSRIIFQNLISNAVKYTPEGGSVKVEIKKDNEKFILITVSDTGYGIPANQQNRTFEKLFRADNVKSTDTEGTGLGLYIIKSIIDSSGGDISFESEENKGTSFFVRLPIKGMKKKEGTKTLGE